MRKVELGHTITVKLSEQQRRIIEAFANRQEVSLGSATRFILTRGINALELAA